MTAKTDQFPRFFAPAVFALLAMGMNLDLLFSANRVLGHAHGDMALQFVAWRDFGFGEMSRGNLPLWNPHIFGGVPFLAGWQSALLYPLNWLHLVLPVNIAINWIVTIHLFLAGWLMFGWCRASCNRSGGSLVAGICWMFSGPYFLHVYAGHLPHLCLMVWAPLLFRSIDGCVGGWNRRGILTGAFALAMMIFAGHPQYVYYTLIVVAAYVGLRLIESPAKNALLGCCAAMAFFAAILSAAQWLPGLDASRELVRSGGLNYHYASSFSLPPENLLTSLAPGFLGVLPIEASSSTPPEYFGRCYLWEMSIFFSVAGLILALTGWIDITRRRQWFWSVMIVLTLLLALGAHTPLHRLLFDHLPGFSNFRGASKFAYLLVMMLCRLSAQGWDCASNRIGGKLPVVVAGFLLLTSLILGLWTHLSISAGSQSTFAGWIRANLEAATDANEIYLDPRLLAKAEFYSNAAAVASRACWWASGTAAAVLAALLLSWRRQTARFALIGIAALEMVVFAWSNRASSEAYRDYPEEWTQALRHLPPDARVHVMDPGRVNECMIRRINAVWGYDPLLQRRYAEMLAASQGIPPSQAGTYLSITSLPGNLSKLLRCAMVLQVNPQQPAILLPDPMPLASLVTTAIVRPNADDLFRLLFNPQLDPRFTVLLESPPAVELSHSASPGKLEVRRIDTDTLHVRAELSAAAMVLVTENYSRGWRVRSASGTSRDAIQPANYAFMGIALPAGSHDFILEYTPAAFQVGAWVSILGWTAFLALLGWQFYSRPGASGSDN